MRIRNLKNEYERAQNIQNQYTGYVLTQNGPVFMSIKNIGRHINLRKVSNNAFNLYSEYL